MIQWIGAAFLVVGFIFLAKLFGLVERSRDVVTIARRSLEVIRSDRLSDEAKESALQRDSKQLFLLFFILAFGGAAAVLLPMGLLWLCDRLGWLSLSSVVGTVLSPAFLITSSILAILALRMKPGKASGKSLETTSYSGLDRALHHVAFKTYTAQVALADIEDAIFSRQLASCRIARPVFITALPRAGTTLLLECCASVPEFASHCYRDMPFVLIPCLWNRFSSNFQQTIESQERAHGDGMQISPDSHEALEEVLWKTFWRRQYKKDRIIPWQSKDNVEFEEFFRSHMRKIILLRRGKTAYAARYISKNNLNIARTKILNQLFPDSAIIIPFRQPLSHSASLLQQHQNFLRIQKKDPFASEYMRAIGHYDFGQNLCPIDFDGWFDRRETRNADFITFWLEYWVASYKHLLKENAHFLNFLNYEALCEFPEHSLKNLAHVVGSLDPEALVSTANRIGRPRERVIDTKDIPASLLREADRIYGELREVSLN
jgi:hypothetical protein